MRRNPKSDDVYLRLMVKLYKFLARRTNAKFNNIIKRRLMMSRINRAPLSISRLARQMKKPGREGKLAVVVGTVTNDIRMREVPKMTVSAIHYFGITSFCSVRPILRFVGVCTKNNRWSQRSNPQSRWSGHDR